MLRGTYLILENSSSKTSFSPTDHLCTPFFTQNGRQMYFYQNWYEHGGSNLSQKNHLTVTFHFIWIKPKYILYCALGDKNKNKKLQKHSPDHAKRTVIYTIPVSHIPSEALKSDELLHLIHSNSEKKKKLVTY